jgi:hypothetical protein
MTDLLRWINSHDCGVSPCGILAEDKQSIIIRVALAHSDKHEETVVKTLAEARDALGY